MYSGDCTGADPGDPRFAVGAGTPPNIPSWGNIMAEGRSLFRIYPHNILYPGIFLALAVLAIIAGLFWNKPPPGSPESEDVSVNGQAVDQQ